MPTLRPSQKRDPVHVTDRQQFEGEDPLWHPSSWRIVTLSTGKSVKAGVGGGTRAKREAWLEAWEQRVIEKAEAEAVE